MIVNTLRIALLSLLGLFFVIVAATVSAQTPPQTFEPKMGQPGKDVVWVPTPDAMVDKMLDMAHVTPQDYVVDLGSGDGRNVIAAALRGARGLGVEYNPDLVELSKQVAAKAGVADKAVFVRGDLYEADISQATVLALFLTPDILSRLSPKLFNLKPGSRIVLNTYDIGGGWRPDETETVRGSCISFCLAILYVVPARVAGSWRMPDGVLALEQEFQFISGTFEISGISLPIENGRLRGEEIQFTFNGVEYSGRVNGNTMEGVAKGRDTRTWTATRSNE